MALLEIMKNATAIRRETMETSIIPRKNEPIDIARTSPPIMPKISFIFKSIPYCSFLSN